MIARVGALLLAFTSTAWAQDGSITPLWLTPEAEIGAMPAERPAVDVQVALRTPVWRLGELAFRSPETLGGEARRAGMSCASCHPAGGANTLFFIPGLSSVPGTVDVTSSAWSPATEDGMFNPLRIPVLWNVASTAPYGSAGRFPALDGFIGHVVRDEFAGEASRPVLAALTTYVASLPAPPNMRLRPDGRLSDKASREAQSGREAFEKGCAGCHRPAAAYQDGRRHGDLNTPSLLGLDAVSRFFHDAGAASLEEAIARHARKLGITHGQEVEGRLLAHVQAIGSVDPPAMVPITIEEDVERIALGVADLGAMEPETLVLAARMLRGEAGQIHARLPLESHAAGRAALGDWAEALREIGAASEGGHPERAAALARTLSGLITETRRSVEAAGPTSLYQPDKRVAWKGKR